MGGQEGKILEVGPSVATLADTTVTKKTFRQHMGGSGLTAGLFLSRVSAEAPLLSAYSILSILLGPLTGFSFPGISVFSVSTRLSLTNISREGCGGGHSAHEVNILSAVAGS